MAKLIDPSFSSGEISADLYGRVDTTAYRTGLRTARNMFVHTWGAISNRPGSIFAGPCKTHDDPPRLIPFRFKTEDTYIIELGHEYARFLRNGYHVVETPIAITDMTAATPVVVTANAHGYTDGDEVYITAVNGMTGLNGGRYIIANSDTNTFELTHQVTEADIDGTSEPAYVSGGQVAKIYQIVTPYQQEDLMQIKYIQSADVVTLVHRNYTPRELQRSDHDDWALVEIEFVPEIGTPANLTVTPNGADEDETWIYRVTAIQDETFNEGSFAEAETADGAAVLDATDSNTISWDAVDGAFRYNVYKFQNGQFGYLGTTEEVSFTDDNSVSPNFDSTPPIYKNPFDENNPGAVGLFEQRRVFGGSANNPDTSWYSRIGDYSNFSGRDPAQDDDAITAVMAERQVNEIRHYVSRGDLLVFTSGAEWKVSAGLDAGFSADTMRQKPQTYWGCNHLAPITIADDIIFVQELSSIVRSFAYSLDKDGYASGDLTVLARHLFQACSSIVDWAYVPVPDQLVHAVRDDGIMLTLTYARDQNVIAWTWNDTQGAFRRVASIPNINAREDIAYFVVERSVDGQKVHYIERLFSRQISDVKDCFFCDSGLIMDHPLDVASVAVAIDGVVTITVANNPFVDGQVIDFSDIEWMPEVDEFWNEEQPAQLNGGRYTITNTDGNTFELLDENDVAVDGSGWSAYLGGGFARRVVSKIYGLQHLTGKTVVALADGSYVEEVLTVANDGSVTLPYPASRVQIGLRYISDVQTLDPEPPGGETLQGRHKRTPSATVRFKNSRGLLIGPDQYHLTEMRQRDLELYGEPTDLLTGDRHITFSGEWNRYGRIFLRQPYPLPMTIAALILDVAVDDPQTD